ncbi:hypothetical protein FRC08_002160 [Ceratobasidium sp. 394]|nr:hypothetical protein FRC08_002160 [Ceratobasidium sp. 394]
MEYVHAYPNQRRGTVQQSMTNAYYNQPAVFLGQQQYTSPDQQTFPQQPFNPQIQTQTQNLYPQSQSQSQWQQPQQTPTSAGYLPTAPRYSHSPQEPPRASLSPPTYTSSSESYITPSPTSNPDLNVPWTNTRWESPSVTGSDAIKMSPSPVWQTTNDVLFSGNGVNGQAPSPNSAVSDNEHWAIGTARGKKQRTEEKEKVKSGACKHCKRLKMKCTFDPPNAATCQRCRSSGQDCVVEGRKPRKNSEPLEQLTAQIEDKEEIIQGLLRIISASQDKLDSAEIWRWIERGARSLMAPTTNDTPAAESAAEEERLPVDSAPFGLLAELSLDDQEEDKSTGRRSAVKEKDAGGDGDVGVANVEYFKPGPMAHPELRRIIVERQMVPEILTLGVVTEEDVEHLFRIFHERIDAVIAIIDPTIHTVAGVKARCPFLFTVICAIASRYWVERPELYTVLMHHAKSAAATAITDGWKSLEVCQAYLLLSVYPQPARSWEEDRAWLYLGCAIRLAMDLNLYKQGARKFVNEAHEREVLNRTRTWLICFNMDRALATKLGRPTTIPEDYIVRHSREWWRRSRYNGRLDVHLCFYTQLLRTVTRYFSLIYSDPDSLSGFNESTEFGPITRAFDDEMEQFKQDAEHTYSTAPEPRHPACQYRLALVCSLVWVGSMC